MKLQTKGGKGAKVSGVTRLSKRDKLAILVGQKGSTQDGSHPEFYKTQSKNEEI